MASQPAQRKNLLHLEQITLQDVLHREYTLRLFIGDEERELQTQDDRTWIPTQRPDVSPTSEIRAAIRMRSGHLFWARYRQTSEVIDLKDLFNDYWSSDEHEFTVSTVITVVRKRRQYRWSLELRFSTSTTAESLRSSLHELETLLREYTPLMSRSTERAVEKSIKYGVALSEVNPIAKALFGVARVTFELLQEQNKHDQLPSGLFDRLQRISLFADKVADEIVCEETDLLEKIIPRMFEVMHKVARFSCDYVRRGKTVGGMAYLETIEEMDRELNKVIEDFMRAVDVEALRSAKRSEKREQERVEQDLLLRRLKPVETGYHLDLRCMEGTRTSFLKEIMDWVTSQSDIPQSNTYWIYGLPGIGKTSLAHSICGSVHDHARLAGAFFCRRDDPNLSELRKILPTLIHKLTEVFPPFRSIVAKHLHDDPNLTPESMKYSLFTELIRKLPRHPEHALVLVIDALDECGDTQSRPNILRALTDAAAHAPWLKLIITSRPEVDIQRFFDGDAKSSHLRYDLAADNDATSDLRIFAQDRFTRVASMRFLQSSWPEPLLFDGVISRADGLFIFIETIALALEHCDDPTEYLEVALHDSAGTGLTSLYGLYSSIVKARKVQSNAEFRRVIGVLLTTTPYRPLYEEAIAELAGVRLDLVKTWVANLSSLLYRTEGINGGIRVRHLSISDFFLSDDCPPNYQVNLRDANAQLAMTCLKTMVEQLRFNICKLEDSRLANADIEGLPSRIKENISDALQYSSLYWSNHLCFTLDDCDRAVWESLRTFFEGPYALFWVEVLSIMGMVPIGVPSLRRVISTLVKDADLTLVNRIQDACRFINTFRTPISMSTPHTYISTQPFLPAESHLSTIFSKRFTKGIKMQSGKLLSWPAPPLKWIGHTRGVNCISYSPNGYYIVTGSLDHTLRIWDAETGTAVGKLLEGHKGSVGSVAYSPDGRYIISGSHDKTIRIWDSETGVAIGEPLVGHNDNVTSVGYSPDGRHIISGSYDRTIRIWDAETGSPVGKPLEGHTEYVRSVAYSPDGQHIISGSYDKTIRIWDAKSGSPVGEPLVGHNDNVLSVAYSPDGRHIISGSSDKRIRIWDAETGSAIGKPLEGHNDYVVSVTYSPDGYHIASGSRDKTIRIWDAETGATISKPLEGHTDYILSVVYSPNGRHIISGSNDNTIRIWDAMTGSPVGKPLEGHSDYVTSVAYSPDGLHIISGSHDKTIRIWNAITAAVVGQPLEGHTGFVRSVAFSPDGRHITSGSFDRTVRIWDAETGSAVGKPLKGHTSHVLSVAYSADGQQVISGSNDKMVRIWDANTGSAIGKPLKGHTHYVRWVACSPDGRHIISASYDKMIRIWDAKTGSAVGEPLKGHTEYVRAVACSPDGRHIISGSHDKTIRIWDAETGAAVGNPLEGHTDHVLSVDYSPDGRHIISGSNDKTIRIWDAESGFPVGQPLVGHTLYVLSVAYSRNGRHIISGSGDNTIRIWDAETAAVGNSFSSSGARLQPDFHAKPDSEGWVRDSEGALLYWVPEDCRTGLHSPALFTLPLTSHIRSVSLDFDAFAFGTSWAEIFNTAQS